jgi:surfeit locus 1 family protein
MASHPRPGIGSYGNQNMLDIKTERLADNIISLPGSSLALLRALFNRRWWWTTLVVLLGMAVLARLGVWQLDRLAQRRAHNAEIVQQLAMPPLPLTGQSLPEDLSSLKYRRAAVQGKFDFSHQIVLQYQNWMDSPGIHLVAPLVIEGTSKAILVDRGWLPFDQATPGHWTQFDEPGQVGVTGFLQLSQALPAGMPSQGTPSEPKSEWYRIDIQAIQAQMPYDLLPVYLLQSPAEAGNTNLPYRAEPEFDLSDGPHLGYAIQWFIFSLLLGIMYVIYVYKKENSQPPPGVNDRV